MSATSEPGLSPEPSRFESALLAEMAHRVVNEFAGAVAILAIELRRCADPDARAAMGRAQDRLIAFAEVHRALIRPLKVSDSCALTDLQVCCSALSRARLEPAGIRLLLAGDPIDLPRDQRWRLALIVTELITNAARHAFDDDGGLVQVTLRIEGPDVVCQVADDGCGAAGGQIGLGGLIVTQLAEDLGGRFELISDAVGTRASILFPTPKSAHLRVAPSAPQGDV